MEVIRRDNYFTVQTTPPFTARLPALLLGLRTRYFAVFQYSTTAFNVYHRELVPLWRTLHELLTTDKAPVALSSEQLVMYARAPTVPQALLLLCPLTEAWNCRVVNNQFQINDGKQWHEQDPLLLLSEAAASVGNKQLVRSLATRDWREDLALLLTGKRIVFSSSSRWLTAYATLTLVATLSVAWWLWGLGSEKAAE